jgi:histidyl-tRNA synthetase
MALSKKPYKGTRDFFPADKRLQNYLFNTMKKTANQFCYEEYDGPMIEEVELYKAKSGEELINDQIYSFYDRGKRFVAIRPEMTPTLARMVAASYRETLRPIRWFSIPNLMRYEKPQRGRLREHWQFNCDIFDAPDRLGEVEILQVAVQLLKNFGATAQMFEVLINDRNIVDATFNQLMKLDSDTTYKLYKIVDRSKKVSSDALKEMVGALNLQSEQEKIFYDYLALKTFEDIFSFLDKHDLQDAKNSFQQFYNFAQEFELAPYLTYDPTIVRGLDYYTGVVFEIFDRHPDNRRAICGGGAYANLLKIFNEEPLTGVGFGLGDVTLTDFLQTHNLLPSFATPESDLLITFQDEQALIPAQKLASQLRAEGANICSTFSKLKFKKVFALAEKKGAKFVALIGDRELAAERVQIKDMQTKEQFDVALNDIAEIIRIIRRD